MAREATVTNKPLSAQQRKFCELYATGRPAGRAYEEAGYSARGASADSAGSKLLRNDKVKEYVTKLQQKSESDTVLSIAEKREFLAKAVRTPVSEIGEENILCTGKTYTKDGAAIIHSVNPITAMQEDSKLAGHYTAEKHDHTHRVEELFENVPTDNGLGRG